VAGLVEQVRACLAAALKLDPSAALQITAETTAADVPAWTSVTHLSLVLELERALGVTFANDEIASLASVPAILAALARKGAG